MYTKNLGMCWCTHDDIVEWYGCSVMNVRVQENLGECGSTGSRKDEICWRYFFLNLPARVLLYTRSSNIVCIFRAPCNREMMSLSCGITRSLYIFLFYMCWSGQSATIRSRFLTSQFQYILIMYCIVWDHREMCSWDRCYWVTKIHVVV